MPRYFAALTIVLLLGMVLTRAFLMRRKGVNAMNFGKIDKTDFIIPPFALFYFYLVFANSFSLPTVSRQEFFHSEIISWLGVLFCLLGLVLLLWSLVSFGRSFRVGIDTEHPDKLITIGIFSFSRNPIYVALLHIKELVAIGTPAMKARGKKLLSKPDRLTTASTRTGFGAPAEKPAG